MNYPNGVYIAFNLSRETEERQSTSQRGETAVGSMSVLWGPLKGNFLK